MGSNPAEGIDVLLMFVVCCVGSGLCDLLIFFVVKGPTAEATDAPQP